MDGVSGGEGLIKATYEAIRNSPLWNRSLLIITYDEHGGFYDSVPPGPAPSPADGSPNDPALNANGFIFDRYGVRVPTIVISPLIPAGSVDHTLYDHTSVLATLEQLYHVPPLTKRDAAANAVLGLLSLATPRTDCPTTLSNPAPTMLRATGAPAGAATARTSEAPLPEAGNVNGVLGVLLKTDLELARGDPAEEAAIRERFASVKTVGDAQAYADEVRTKVTVAQANRTAKPPLPSRVG
jgi:phospholipase C